MILYNSFFSFSSRDISVGDEIRSTNKYDATSYRSPQHDSISTNDRAKLYSASPPSIPSQNSHREGSVNWGMQVEDDSPPRPARPSYYYYGQSNETQFNGEEEDNHRFI